MRFNGLKCTEIEVKLFKGSNEPAGELDVDLRK
jgi:hypothetical protein